MSVSTEQQLLDPPVDDQEPDPKRFYGVTTGRVINQADPMFLGRVQLQLPFIDALDLSPWARVAVPMSGIVSGMYFMPELGDEVLVAFEQGDINVPYVIGSLWNGFAPPPFPTPYAQMRGIRTPLVFNTLTFMEAPPTIILAAPAAGQTVTLSEAGTTIASASAVEILAGAAAITVSPAGVQIAGATITLAATTALNLTAPAINITAAADCTITGAMVIINP
jgi:uncharacterized protein involved in type VI secretion and phage assembly